MSRLKFSLILACWTLILSLGVASYVLTHDQGRLSQAIAQQIAHNFPSLSLNVGGFRVQFFPSLKITLHDVLLRHEPELQIFAPQAELSPGWNILHGQLDLKLIDPILMLKTTTEASNQVQSELQLPKGLQLSLQQGHLIWQQNQQTMLQVTKLDLLLENNSLQAQGQLLWQNQDLAWSLDLDFKLQPQLWGISRLRLDIDKNRLEFKGQFQPKLNQLTGLISGTNLSLPRWLEFARNLPSGLQTALHSMSGQGQLTLDANGLSLEKLHARIAGMDLQGELQFKAWQLQIKAHTELAKLNSLFPELINLSAPQLQLPPVPLIPTTPSSPDLDYQLSFTAHKVQGWRLAGEDLKLHISPYKTPKPSKTTPAQTGTQIQTSFKLAQGQAQARLFFPSNTSNLDLDIQGQHLDLTSLFKQIAPKEPKPLLIGTAQLNLQGQTQLKNELTAFLSTFKGSLNLQAQQGQVNLRQSYLFDNLKLLFIGQGQQAGSNLFYTGTTQVFWEHDQSNFKAQGSGPYRISTQTWLLDEFRGQLSSLIFQSPSLKGQASTDFNLNLKQGHLNLNNLQLAFTPTPSKRIESFIAADIQSTNLLAAVPDWNINWQLTTTEPKAVANYLDLDLNWMPTTAAKQLTIKGLFQGQPQNFKLTQLKGQLDETAFKGDLAYQNQLWQGNLHLGDLNLDNYLPAASGQNTPWPVQKLKGINLKLFLFFNRLHLGKFRLDLVEVPLSLQQGTLTLPWYAQCYGGKLEGNLTLAAQPNTAWAQFIVQAQDLQVLKLSQEQALPNLVAGIARFKLKAEGMITSTADLPQALTGTWDFDLKEGYLMKNRPNQTGPRTTINLLSAEGLLKNSLFSSSNLYFNGGGYSIKGQGAVNLSTWHINYNLLLNGYGLSNLPLNYSGPLSSPQTKIKLVDLFAGLLSGIGRGIFGLLEKTLKAPLQIF